MNLVNSRAFRDPYFTSSVLVLHCDGTDGSTTFTDSSESANTITANGDAQVDTAQVKYGTGAYLSDGTGDYLTAPNGVDFQFPGDFTLELWARPTSGGPTDIIYDSRSSDSDPNGFTLYRNAGQLRVYTNGTNIISGGTLSAATWAHLAVCRSGSSIRMFINGTQSGSTATYATSFSTGNCRIGQIWNAGAFSFNGHLDDIRITKGVARYTANFTPPPYPAPNR